jgi:hypothetical protein
MCITALSGSGVFFLWVRNAVAETVASWGGHVARLVEFPLEDGGSVLVQVDEAAPGPATRGLGDRHTVTAQSLLGRLRTLADAPDEVGLEFGLELSAEAGAFIASASSTANFRVTLTWRRDRPG